MGNTMMTNAPSATVTPTPTARWVAVRDGRGRPHLEMRWSVPTVAAQAQAA